MCRERQRLPVLAGLHQRAHLRHLGVARVQQHRGGFERCYGGLRVAVFECCFGLVRQGHASG